MPNGLFDWVSDTVGNIASIPAIVQDKIILDGIGGSGSTAGYSSGNVSIGTPGFDVMSRARQDLNEQLAYLENLRKMIETSAIQAGASPEDAQKAAVTAVPINAGSTVSGTEEVSGVSGIGDTSTASTASTIPTPQETFQDLEEEQKIGRINDALNNNPNATVADILDILTSWNIPIDLFRKATGGLSPEEYVAATSTDGGTEGGTDGSTDGGTDGGTDNGNGGTNGGVVSTNGGGGDVVVTDNNNGGGPVITTTTATTTGGGDGDLNTPTETPLIIPQLPQQSQTETTTGGLLFAAAAPSPTRTTDEVLAPDLFKLNTNIPLVGKLTQYSPMAAPQYLLSGISQRYKV